MAITFVPPEADMELSFNPYADQLVYLAEQIAAQHYPEGKLREDVQDDITILLDSFFRLIRQNYHHEIGEGRQILPGRTFEDFPDFIPDQTKILDEGITDALLRGLVDTQYIDK